MTIDKQEKSIKKENKSSKEMSKPKKKHSLTLENKSKVGEEEEELCSICANPFQIHSIGSCNHSICHVCSLRLRTLYKTNTCPLCKTDIDTIVYSPRNALFESFESKKLERDIAQLKGCIYVNDVVKQVVKQTIALTCPECKLECSSWKELKAHAKVTHSKLFCELCTKFGHSFTWESKLYSSTELKKHQSVGDSDTSFKGHPECGFCKTRFYSNDELFDHCHKQHESCFLCTRLHNIQNQYFKSYKVWV
jgi:hypothetical protein